MGIADPALAAIISGKKATQKSKMEKATKAILEVIEMRDYWDKLEDEAAEGRENCDTFLTTALRCTDKNGRTDVDQMAEHLKDTYIPKDVH